MFSYFKRTSITRASLESKASIIDRDKKQDKLLLSPDKQTIEESDNSDNGIYKEMIVKIDKTININIFKINNMIMMTKIIKIKRIKK